MSTYHLILCLRAAEYLKESKGCKYISVDLGGNLLHVDVLGVRENNADFEIFAVEVKTSKEDLRTLPQRLEKCLFFADYVYVCAPLELEEDVKRLLQKHGFTDVGTMFALGKYIVTASLPERNRSKKVSLAWGDIVVEIARENTNNVLKLLNELCSWLEQKEKKEKRKRRKRRKSRV